MKITIWTNHDGKDYVHLDNVFGDSEVVKIIAPLGTGERFCQLFFPHAEMEVLGDGARKWKNIY